MFKLININALREGQINIKEFLYERDAMFYIEGLAEAFSIADFRISVLPTPKNDSDEVIQWLIVEKDINPYDNNAGTEKLSFVLAPLDKLNKIVLVDNSDVDDTDDDNRVSISVFSDKNINTDEMLEAAGFSCYKKTRDVSFYKSDYTNVFIL